MAHQENDSREEVPTVEVEMTWCGGKDNPPPDGKPPVIDLPMESLRDYTVKPEEGEYWPSLPASDSYR